MADRSPYRKATRRHRTLLGYSQLWFGDGHLLLVKSTRFSEEYQRFAFSSIQAFVVTEYFGYLRRDPDALFLTWLAFLDANPGSSRTMVSGFMNSQEYRLRFGATQ